MGGRPKKSVAQKKLQGTFRSDRHSEQEANEAVVATTCFTDGTVIEIPKEITDEYVSDYYRFHTNQLIALHLLAPSDIPELNIMYFTLQQLRAIQKSIQETSIEDIEKYEKLTKLAVKLGNQFSDLAKKYYISPVSRTRIQLDALALEQKKAETKSAIGKLLSNKQS